MKTILLFVLAVASLSATTITGRYFYADNNLSGPTVINQFNLSNGVYSLNAQGLQTPPGALMATMSVPPYLASVISPSTSSLSVSIQLPNGYQVTSADGATAYVVSGTGTITFNYSISGGTLLRVLNPGYVGNPFIPQNYCETTPVSVTDLCSYSLSGAQATLTSGRIDVALATTGGAPAGRWNETFTASGSYAANATRYPEIGTRLEMNFTGVGLPATADVPEPATSAMLLGGLIAVGFRVGMRRR